MKSRRGFSNGIKGVDDRMKDDDGIAARHVRKRRLTLNRPQ